jgi:hypothetical protein
MVHGWITIVDFPTRGGGERSTPFGGDPYQKKLYKFV